MKAKRDDKWLSCIAPCSLGPWDLKKKVSGFEVQT